MALRMMDRRRRRSPPWHLNASVVMIDIAIAAYCNAARKMITKLQQQQKEKKSRKRKRKKYIYINKCVCVCVRKQIGCNESDRNDVNCESYVVTGRPRRPRADNAIARTGDVTLLLVWRFVGNVADGVVDDEILHHVDTP